MWPYLQTARWKLRPAHLGDLSALQTATRDPRFPENLPLAQWAKENRLEIWLNRMIEPAGGTRL